MTHDDDVCCLAGGYLSHCSLSSPQWRDPFFVRFPHRDFPFKWIISITSFIRCSMTRFTFQICVRRSCPMIISILERRALLCINLKQAWASTNLSIVWLDGKLEHWSVEHWHRKMRVSCFSKSLRRNNVSAMYILRCSFKCLSSVTLSHTRKNNGCQIPSKSTIAKTRELLWH